METLKKRIFQILEVVSPEDRLGRIVEVSIMTLIGLNVIAVIISTIPNIASKYSLFFYRFEVFSIAIFSIEYLLRLWVCTKKEEYSSPIMGRLKYALTPFALVDLIAILPFYLPLAFTLDLRFIRVLRLLRLFRMFKFARYSKALIVLGSVLKEKKEELIITISTVLILLVFASSFMFYFENEAQPDVFSSIPSTLWWGVATLTTVGYGDIYPITPIGKIFGGCIALLGIGIFALPAGILASGFTEVLQSERKGKITCPHCGKPIE